MSTNQQIAGIVLCGGRSHRMGRAKYRLIFSGETLLRRICRIAGSVASPVVVVAAADQELSLGDFPAQKPPIVIVRDQESYAGPLYGIFQGLQRVLEWQAPVEAAFVTGCDSPLLRPDAICWLRQLLSDDFEAVVIRDGEYSYPLFAIYRVSVLSTLTDLLASGERRATALPARLKTRWVPVEEFKTIDPDLDSLRNCNTPEDLLQAQELHFARASGRIDCP